MKIKLLILSIIVTIFPFSINALTPDYDIKQYEALYEVKSNGDVDVTEIIVQSGIFNGYEIGLSTKSELGENIYNPYKIENIIVYTNGVLSTLNSHGSNGKNNIYTITKDYNDIKIKMYEYTNNNAVTYKIKYTLKDLIVGHNDINELYYNFLININDKMSNPKITVKLPVTDNNIRAFGHGPLSGNVKILNNQNIVYELDKYTPGNAIDGRILFNKNISNPNKQTNINSFDKILAEEEVKANQANQEREKAKQLLQTITISLNIGLVIWYIGAAALFIYSYLKYDKEHKLIIKYDYFREIPSNLEPGVVEYLDKKTITTKALVASIMDLIRLKALKIETISNKKKEDYQISNDNINIELTECQQCLKNWLIDDIGNGEMFLLSALKKQSNSEETAKKIINKFDIWKNKVKILSEKENYYEEKPLKIILLVIILFFTSFGLMFLAIKFEYKYIIFAIITILVSVSLLIYICISKKRTLKGAIEHNKWMGLKKFMNDFGKFDDKELPEIILWEQYLVYATLFGIADKVIKVMKIKLESLPDYNQDLYNNYTLFYIYNISMFNHFNTAITNGINNSISTVNIANSNASSGSGFGGGFSGGGGGGGGGRSGGGF